jgi:hypothetical protein
MGHKSELGALKFYTQTAPTYGVRLTNTQGIKYSTVFRSVVIYADDVNLLGAIVDTIKKKHRKFN